MIEPAPQTPRRPRHDGWTQTRRTVFVAALDAGVPVAKAAAAVGMSRMAAYRLRQRADGAAVAAAWPGSGTFDREALLGVVEPASTDAAFEAMDGPSLLRLLRLQINAGKRRASRARARKTLRIPTPQTGVNGAKNP